MNYPLSIKVNGRQYKVSYEISRKLRSSVRIGKDGVKMKISRYAFSSKRDEIVEKFLNWAKKRLSKAGNNTFIEPLYEDNGRICVHNKIYEINVEKEERKTTKSVLDGGVIKIYFNKNISYRDEKKFVKFFAEKIVMSDQEKYLKETIDELNQLYFKVKYDRVRFKRMNSRFGSCSRKGNINIAYRLLFAPKEVFRYVCVHELSHLKEFSHSKNFWGVVKEACPNFKESEKWLRESGFLLG